MRGKASYLMAKRILFPWHCNNAKTRVPRLMAAIALPIAHVIKIDAGWRIESLQETSPLSTSTIAVHITKKVLQMPQQTINLFLHRVSWFLNCYLSCILILGLSECHIKTAGFCIKNDGNNQNSGVIKKNSLNGNTTEAREQCLATCKETDGATGCEVIWDQHNRGCYVHTQEIARGNGVERHMCWVFSNCSGTWLF